MTDNELWVPVARAATVEEVRDELLAWCEANGLSDVPAPEDLRWH